MMVTIPPLWRDADAYVQLTQPPLIATFWNHGPAYCYLSKIPLFIGEHVERWQRRPPSPGARVDPSQPALTDTGVWILIVSQHLALNLALFYFIAAVTRRFWIRLALALIWASNALFYTLAHCVGSETLGVILVAIFCTKALRLARSPEEPTWKQWYSYAIILLLCLATRDLNLAFTLVLPATFLTAWVQQKFVRPAGRPSRPTRHLANAIIAAVLSIACVILADSAEHSLARKTRLHPHSRIGFTFMWRLRFLDALAPEARTAMLEKVKARAPNDSVRYLINLREEMRAEKADLEHPGPFMNRAIGYFGGNFHWEDLDGALNQMALTFLWPPLPELLSAAWVDFVGAIKEPPEVTSEHLFATTTYFFDNKEELSAAANLVTFRGDMSSEKIQQLFLEHRYFHLWNGLPYVYVAAVWFMSLLCYVIARRLKCAGISIAPYSIALFGAGLSVFAASCLVHSYEPRFTLSMWQGLILSLLLLVGSGFDLLHSQGPTLVADALE